MADEGLDGLARHTNVRMGGNGVGVVEYGGGASGQSAIFYTRAVHNPAKSAAAGCPIHEDVVYVRIAPPGERLNIVDRPASRDHTRLWPREWAAFQEGREQHPDGTPIDQLYPDSPAKGATLRANGIHTIQQCAELSANAIENLQFGGQGFVNDAVRYLKSAEGGAASVQLRRDLEASQRDVKVLSSQLDTLKGEIERLKTGKREENVTMTQAQLQELLSGAQGRPVMPLATETKSARFDAATEQINATSPRAQKPSKRVKV